MTRLTTVQKNGLTNQNAYSQRGTLGARIDALEYGTVATPSAGSIAPLAGISYAVTPAIGTATKIHAAVTLTTAVQTITDGITQPDFPRILSVKGAPAGTLATNVTINGTDIAGTVIADTIQLNNSSEVMGDVAFKTVTSIVFPIRTGEGDTVSVGFGNLLGFPVAVPNASTVIAKTFNGAVDAGSVTVGATPSTSYYTCAGAASFNGTKILSFVLLV